jgi:hypothetical protein
MKTPRYSCEFPAEQDLIGPSTKPEAVVAEIGFSSRCTSGTITTSASMDAA